MKIIEMKAEFVTSTPNLELVIEKAARTCYRSEKLIKKGSAEKIFNTVIKQKGHESCAEHGSITMYLTIDRAVLAQLTRHRHFSFSVESQRYCLAGDTILKTSNPHNKLTIKGLYDNKINSKNGAWKRMKIKQFNERTGELQFANIENVFENGEKEVFELKTELGYTLKCTSEHEILTDSGYKKLKDLKKGDSILVNGIEVEKDVLYKNKDWIFYQSVTLDKTYVQIANEFNFNVNTVKKWAKKLGMPPKQLGKHTIGREPWNKGLKESDDERVKKQAEALRKYHCNGNKVKKGTIFKPDTTKYVKHRKSECEICCGSKNLQVHHKDENRDNNNPDNLITLCQKCHGQIHNKNLEIAHFDKIVSIESKGMEMVYDIEMKSEFHNFVANGIVVHNCNYSKDKFDKNVSFIKPLEIKDYTKEYDIWVSAMAQAELHYFSLLEEGLKPETARSVLPNSTKCELTITGNVRQWRNFFKLRGAGHAQAEIKLLSKLILDEMVANGIPKWFFDDIPFDY